MHRGGMNVDDMIGDRGLLEVESLPFWTGPIKVWPLEGGLSNRNFGVQQADGQRFAVRLGQDRPEHGIMRFNEQAAAKAAARAGISPKIYYMAPGVMVSRLLPGRSLQADEVQRPENLLRIAALLRRCHTSMGAFLQGPILAFWVFQVIRSYGITLTKTGSSLGDQLSWLMETNDLLESRAGPVDVVLCHNDLTAGNIFDDGARLWLLDWDYAGFNTPLFDLANLSVNNGFYPPEEAALLQAYYGRDLQEDERETFTVLKCAALLRTVLASAVDELSSQPSVDHRHKKADFIARLEQALAGLN